ncbi:MAG: hypothetical protein Ct9H300mP3_11930 [Gammaproteobacteria bacterium]|nr:MAG: hypothetical protein Ct9H300mP3_11930 [Gammaproteobacteria bacterium]
MGLGKGMERVVARDSGLVLCNKGRCYREVDASRIVVRVNEKEIKPGDSGLIFITLLNIQDLIRQHV